jgi:membrane protein implicated in regulation of membrane protease activity
MRPGEDGRDSNARLAEIEAHLNETRLLLRVLVAIGFVLIVVLLPGLFPALVVGGFLGVVLLVAAGGFAWVSLYVLDAIFLRRSREKREREMEQRLEEELRRHETERQE